MEFGSRTPFKLRRIATAILFTSLAPSAQAALVADGKLDGVNGTLEGYTLGYTIGFIDDKGNAIGDGKLFFGEDASGQYLYFQMPLNYVDNTYGTNASAGWTKGHTFDNLLGSDSLGAKSGVYFSWSDASGKNEVTIDYLAGVCNTSKCTPTTYQSGGVGPSAPNSGAGSGANWTKNEGKINVGSAASLLNIATSLEYNLANVDPSATTNSSLNPNWIKEVGYEIQFAKGTFNAADWADPAKAVGLITLGSPHVSPSMTGFGGYTNPSCFYGCNGQAPEPGTIWLLLGGLGGLGWLARRQKRRRLAASDSTSSCSPPDV